MGVHHGGNRRFHGGGAIEVQESMTGCSHQAYQDAALKTVRQRHHPLLIQEIDYGFSIAMLLSPKWREIRVTGAALIEVQGEIKSIQHIPD